MSEHRATTDWRRETPDFDYPTYNRGHRLRFGAGIELPAAAAAASIPATAVGAAGVDPEQALVASISSCHMLWFLHLACQSGFVVDRYVDEAVGLLEKNAEGRGAVTRVTLRPRVAFSGTPPTEAEHASLHHRAHERCFIANSVKSEVVIEPGIA
ncbi:MAG: OsmC family protein [Betaproteobacteria bacterium]|nr:OsmC family protein [Betaproteobacteria bacterium]